LRSALAALLIGSLFLPHALADTDPQLLWRRAIDNDDASALRRLLDEAPLTTTNEKGKTALMTAAKLGDFALYRQLLDLGLDPLRRSNTGGTVLMYSVLGNRLEFVEFVLRQRPDIDLQSTNGWTAAMIAAAKGFGDALNLLVAADADINIADAYRWSPLMRAIDNRHPTTVEILARHPEIQLNWQNENRATALHIAASVGDVRTVELLLSLGAETDLQNNEGLRAVDVARLAGQSEIAQMFTE
jgi:ankyrin repeat protein